MSDVVHVKIEPNPPRPGQLVMGMIITVLPVALAILMQKPALRQFLAMRACHYAKVTGDRISEVGNRISTRAATGYNRARL